MELDSMIKKLKKSGRPLSSFKRGDTIEYSNKMSKGSYTLSENPGENFSPRFTPYVTPEEMLSLGVFGGKYLNDCILEFPAEWFLHAALFDKLRPVGKKDPSVNLMKVNASIGRSKWIEFGWLPSTKTPKSILSDKTKNPDERGWFQWYCRYWLGRRIPALDAVQIGRPPRRQWAELRPTQTAQSPAPS